MMVRVLMLLMISPVAWAETWECGSPSGSVRDINANQLHEDGFANARLIITIPKREAGEQVSVQWVDDISWGALLIAADESMISFVATDTGPVFHAAQLYTLYLRDNKLALSQHKRSGPLRFPVEGSYAASCKRNS